MKRITRAPLALALLACTVSVATAGQLTVRVTVPVPGYKLVRTAHEVTVFDDGETRTTIRGAHYIETVGGTNDGDRRPVAASSSSRPSPDGVPSSSVTTQPRRVVRTVPPTTRVERVTVFYDSDLTLATLTTGSDINTSAFAYDPPATVLDETDAAVVSASNRVDEALLASLTADTEGAQAVDARSQEHNATLAGDPVSVATGELVVDETDFELAAGAVRVRVGRIHRAGRSAGGSLGGGWFFPLDSRIVLGESPEAAEAVDGARAILAELLDPERGLRAAVDRAADAAIAERAAPLGDSSRAASQARELEGALRAVDYRGRLRDEVTAEVTRRANRAAAIAAELERLAHRMRDEIARIDGPIRSSGRNRVDAAVEEIRRRIAELEAVETVSRAHRRRNARFAAFPAGELAAAGTDSVIVVGPDGRARRYLAETPPDPSSPLVYSDGSANRYPDGCSYASADPGAPRLELSSDGTFTLLTRDGVSYRYGFFGELRRIDDPNGNFVALEYDEHDRLFRVVDSRGRELVISRDGSGRVGAIDAPGGVGLQYRYDERGRLVRVVDAAGEETAYAYAGEAGSPRLATLVNPDGSERTFSYRLVRGRWRTVAVTDETGATEHFDFDRPGRTVHTNPSGIATVYEYDERNLTTSVVDGAGYETTFTYDAGGRLVASRAPDGATTRHELDRAGHRLVTRHPDGTVERWTRDARGRALRSTDRAGRTTRYAYDRPGNLVRVDHPDGTHDRYERVPPGEPAAGSVRVHVDRRGNRTVYEYDELGFVRGIDDSEGPVVRFENDEWGRPRSVTDGTGATTLFTRRADGLVTSVRGPEGLAVEVEYSVHGDAVRIVENGRATIVDYDDRHLPVVVTDAAGVATRYTYRADGLATERRVEDADGTVERVTRYTYDARGLPTEVLVHGADAPQLREYDARGRVAAVVDAAGSRTEYAWNADDRLVRLTRYVGAEPVVERFEYLPGGGLGAHSDAMGATTRFERDPTGRREIREDPTGVRSTTIVDPYGLPLAITDGNGRERRFDYDARGRLTGVWNEEHREATYDYDAANRLVGFTDGEGERWRYRYDGRGRLVEVVHPDGASRTMGYNTDGTTAAVTDETGLVTRYEYDQVGRLRARIDPSGPGRERRTLYERDVAGEVVAVTDPTGRTTRFDRDGRGRVVGVVDPEGNRTTVRLDPVGRVLEQTDPTGRTAWYRYDELGRLEARGRGETISESYAYDAAGNLLARVDALGHAHRLAYDRAGRLLAETNRSGATRTYRYDAAGSLVETTDYTGLRARYRSDAGGALVAVDYADGSRLRYEYDRAGRLRVAENEHERVEIERDARGRVTSVTAPVSGTHISFSWDEAGRRVAREDRETGTHTTYRYDARGMLASVHDSAAGTIFAEHDSAGRQTRITMPTGMTTNTTYDAAGRVASSVTRSTTGEMIAALAHVYDDAGRRRYDVDHASRITSYAYDEMGRLVAVEYPFDGPKRASDFERFVTLGRADALPGGASELPGPRAAGPGATVFAGRLSATQEDAAAIEVAFRRIYPLRKGDGVQLQQVWTERFDYDEADNRTAWRTGWGSIEYTYDTKGRLATAGELAYSYDMAGSVAAVHGPGGTTTYAYSPQHRVVEATTPAGRVAYAYDALGRRIARIEQPPAGNAASAPLRKPTVPNGSRRTSYRYDGLGFAVASREVTDLAAVSTATGLRKPVVEPPRGFREAQGALRSANANARTFSEVTVGGATIAVCGPDGSMYLAHDLLGSVVATAGRSAAGAERYEYDAFGTSLAGPASPAMPYGYAGKRRDPVTGHSDYGFRDYAPELGRFTTSDPARDGGNWYVYVRADPVNLVDPWGLEAAAAQITFTMALDYTHATDTLAMDFRELHDGEVVDNVLRTWDASNNRRVREVGSDEPAWYRDYYYYPGPFPEGEWQVTSAGISSNPMIGQFLRTDAVIDVQTYEPGLGAYVPGPVRQDEDGFLIHGGGYTSNDLYDPNGNNRWEDNTIGCLRLRNADMAELAGYARRALESGGASTIAVDREE